MARALIVDAANVVGSKPDGWWKDRVGAARRLLKAIASAELSVKGEEREGIVVVLEGQAKGAAPLGPLADSPQVVVVHAPGEGDDHIVEQAKAFVDAGYETVIVTNDRGLTGRIRRIGARTTSVGAFRRDVGY